MFIETLSFGENNLKLAFIKSLNVQAFPCGRRRANLSGTAETGKAYIPFDPEARLNTEANNRQHSGLNGFTQTYLERWENNMLALSLAGYLFKIKLEDKYITPGEFGKALYEVLGKDPDATSIYANIRISSTPLFSADFAEYHTSVLRNQTASAAPLDAIDVLSTQSTAKRAEENYYFAGLSFSTRPITVEEDSNVSDKTAYSPTRSTYVKEDNEAQLLVSLRILDLNKNNSTEESNWLWQIHEPARLPRVEHGDEAGSVKLDKVALNDLTAGSINASELYCNAKPLSMLEVVPNEETGAHRLVFSFAKNNTN